MNVGAKIAMFLQHALEDVTVSNSINSLTPYEICTIHVLFIA